MNIKRSLAVVLLMAISVTSAKASVLSGAITQNGSEDLLSTTSPAGLASWVDVDGGGTFTPGDVIYGFLVANGGVNDWLTAGASPISFSGGYAVAMFSAQLATGNGGFNLVTPVTTAGLRLADLIDPTFAAELAGHENDAMVAVISGGVGGNPLNGFVSANNSSGDGLKYFTPTGPGGPFTLDFAANTADVGSGDGFFQFATGGGTVGQQRGGFNIIPGIGDMGDLSYLDVAIASLFSPPSTTEAQIGLDTTFVNSTVSAAGRGWQFQTTSDGIRLNVAPEPTSIFVWGLIACAAGLKRRTR